MITAEQFEGALVGAPIFYEDGITKVDYWDDATSVFYALYHEDPSGPLFVEGVGLIEKVEETSNLVDEYTKNLTMIVRVGNQYFRKTGYHASYDGTYFDGTLEEVEKRPVTRVEWAPVER